MSQNTSPNVPTTAYGTELVSAMVPVTQLSSRYELLEGTRTFIDSESTGSVSVIDSMFTCSTGIDSSALSGVVSLRALRFRMGQGSVARVSAKFSPAVIDNAQQVGLLGAENSLTFGFNVAGNFGITHFFDGSVEIQVLTITTPAAGAENASVTVSGVVHSVPLTAGTANHNANEIATFLDDNIANYDSSANQNEVTVVSLSPFVSGAFAFSSSTAVAAWDQVTAANPPNQVFYPQESWTVDVADWLDVTKGNEYQIRFSWPFGAVFFYIMHPGGIYELVHVIDWSNTKDIPLMTNPTMQVGWAVQNVGNTTDVVIQGASASVFNEGPIRLSSRPLAIEVSGVSIGTTLTNLVTIRNRDAFGGKTNQTEAYPLISAMATESNKAAFFDVLIDATFADEVVYEYQDETGSIIEQSFSPVEVTGGRIIASFVVVVGSSVVQRVNAGNVLDNYLLPGDTLTIASRVSGGAAADMQASLTWKEDL